MLATCLTVVFTAVLSQPRQSAWAAAVDRVRRSVERRHMQRGVAVGELVTGGPPAAVRGSLPVRAAAVRRFGTDASSILSDMQYIKNSTRSRDGSACIRSVSSQAHTQTASHPLTWCHADGVEL